MKRLELGIRDDAFVRGDIPMTKQEIRVLALAQAKIGREDVVIDIGAGTGSLTVEAARQAERGQVIAIEREEEGVRLIKDNAAKFGVNNIRVILGSAPEAMSGLPPADVIFIGGSGGQLEQILEQADNLLKTDGRLIVTAVTVETLHHALAWADSNPRYTVNAFGVQISRIRPVGAVHMFQALNQVFIVACNKHAS
ncbi:MAG: precorrin-6Y C5,15-methyltransferase (decarboxylating) subunit CbiT [Negativicutes bacterium]|nr:precorrin-6Y C5,15-methyltransferase (decarboxylating) subunit CbiT [Negativicutes bacterium]